MSLTPFFVLNLGIAKQRTRQQIYIIIIMKGPTDLIFMLAFWSMTSSWHMQLLEI